MNRPRRATIQLPRPRRRGRLSVEEALAGRRSVREFRNRPLTRGQLSQLLWATQGVTTREGDRTVPSAGGLFPLEVYVASAEGLFHYEPEPHRLERLSGRDPRRAIHRLALEQAPLLKAPAVFILAAVYQRVVRRYEAESRRYVLIEVGHAAQNLLLQAVGLGLGSVVIGAFYDAELRKALRIPVSHRPLYLIAVGPPA